jgi:trimethylamine-N-oxide reductase (cytochrome c)
VHAQLDDSSWNREMATCKVKGPDGYLYEPLWIHPSEAVTRGIEDGDICKVINERGTALVGARVTERVMPGVAHVDHGARQDYILPGVLDRGGAINTITPHNITSKLCAGTATSGFLVQVAPVDLEGLRKQYPEAFGRPYSDSAGLLLEPVLANGDH